MEISIFALYGSWEALVVCKILLRGLGIVSRPGKPDSENCIFFDFLWRGCHFHEKVVIWLDVFEMSDHLAAEW